ncbi:class I SAM-dependent methyltransferase [Microvirga terrestris]|uniref:Class I SAM-dependent methyltransferase n=1 Tax=Microvirga terrestris TaxID=2791024 RepID=A0ABS0HQ71_9HYPH|nr:class I SAM-dependent methyltransferase [Microvirga terrestris]MBF9195350.1 class I SAM-dependent methyltransferase [Microvirga terrestris]
MALDDIMNLTAEQRDWYHRTFAKWHEVMRPYDGFQPGGLLQRLPVLPADLLAECKVVPRRDDILPDMPKRGRIAEVGTQQGLYADKILAICQPSELHLFDIDLNPLKARTDTNLISTAILHEGDSSTRLAEMPDDYFDWIYLDADHSYSAVKKDTEVARTKVKPGGHIVFNDFTIWSPIELIPYGVPHAVHELMIEHRWPMTHLAFNPLLYCDVALRRPA